MKENNFLFDFQKGLGMPINNQKYVTNWGWMLLHGMFIGIALNDIWRIFKLPGENVPVVAGNQAFDIELDFVYQLIIAGLVVIAQAFGLKYGSGFGAGMALGSVMANTSETGKTISILPISMEDKQ